MLNITTLNTFELQQKLQLLGQLYDLPENWLQDKPNLFSSAAITLPAHVDETIKSIIYAIEQVVNLPAYQEITTASVYNPSTAGVFLSYDFHLGEHGPQLIEINSNAGGSSFANLLNAAGTAILQNPNDHSSWEEHVIQMFQQEWQLKRRPKPLQCIAIVDENPSAQPFYPEFLIFKALFKSHGIETLIADPAELTLENNQLTHRGRPIDLVYNRLTDFLLEEPKHVVLRQAYENDQVVLSPHPYVYSLYANKRNLILLSDTERLRQWGVAAETLSLLQTSIPTTITMAAEQAEELWEQRKTLFFKPCTSFGGKGAFRGSKITRNTFASIIQQDYIAQTFVPPSEISFMTEGQEKSFKMDIRYYTYQDQVLNKVARIYQGQTTNFRSFGGGFALLGAEK